MKLFFLKNYFHAIPCKIFKLVLLTTVIALVFSCSKNENQLETNIIDTNFVSKSEAKEFAMKKVNFNKKSSNKKNSKLANINSSSNEIFEILEFGNEKPSFYIINYANGGFVIVSGDKRLEPILAFSETNSFNLKSSTIPSGLIAWMSNMDETIINLRKNISSIDKETSTKNKMMWVGNQKIGFNPDDPDIGNLANCTQEGASSSESTQTGPLINTEWGQTSGYNVNSPDKGCPNGKLPPTGCVATAMAQIMRYHQKPSPYNWSNMPNYYSTSETAKLMRDVGKSVGMDYTCDGSSAETSKTANAFVNSFGYTSAKFQEYNYNVVVSEIKANRPVILSGGKNDGWWIFGHYADGHAWVCDGLMEIKNYECKKTYTPFSPNPILMKQQTSSQLFLHMNWGWHGSHDGYYAYNNFNPSTSTYNYKQGMVVNIKP